MTEATNPLSGQEFARLQAGDPEAFRKVFDACAGLVQHIAARCGVPPEERDDITQEVFLRLHANVRQLTGPDKIRAWLAVTARRLIIDGARKGKRRATVAVGEGINAVDTPMWAVDEEDAAREQDVALVQDLIAEVAGDPGGASFREFYQDGLTAREIAERNGEAVSTVTTRLSRLRKRFKQRFADRLDDLRSRQP